MGSPGRISARILLILGSLLVALAITYSLRAGRPSHPAPGTREARKPGVEATSPATVLPESPGTEQSDNGANRKTGPETKPGEVPSATPAPTAIGETASPPSAPPGTPGHGVPSSLLPPAGRGEQQAPIHATAPPTAPQPGTESPGEGEAEEADGPAETGDSSRGASTFTSQGAGPSAPAASPGPAEAPPGRRSASSGGGAPAAGDPGVPPRTAHVRMVPDATEVVVGNRLSLRILISEAADVGSVPFHLFYDPSVLKFEGGEEGEFLRGDGRQTAFFAAPTSGGNEVVVGLSRLGKGNGRNGGGELCTLQFTVVGPGDPQLQFDQAKVRTSSNLPAPAVFEPLAILAR